MDAHNELTAQERAVLRALLQGPATGIRTVAERIACRRLSADNDMARLQESITAIRALMTKKLIVKRQIEGGSLVLRITRQGRKTIEPERSLASFGKLALSLSAAYAVAGLAGRADYLDIWMTWWMGDLAGDGQRVIAHELGVEATRITIRDAASRWGSCRALVPMRWQVPS